MKEKKLGDTVNGLSSIPQPSVTRLTSLNTV